MQGVQFVIISKMHRCILHTLRTNYTGYRLHLFQRLGIFVQLDERLLNTGGGGYLIPVQTFVNTAYGACVDSRHFKSFDCIFKKYCL